ncbi:MAG TPA: PAAR domain-containing protein [Pyrinomonadaceae bacterium]|nr:PAAR domain-containing protein [Pyrinomonadaceae bacterium]
MPKGPAARMGVDTSAHPLPPTLTPGPGSLNVMIGFAPAWRGMPLAAVAALQVAKKAADTAIQVAEAATKAAAGTPGAPAALAAEQAAKAAALSAMSSAITGASGGADINMCAVPSPVPPHGPGVVISGSPTVMINNLPASRLGDDILEAIGPPNKITKGEVTVIIGDG